MFNSKFEAQIYQIAKRSYIILFIYFKFEWFIYIINLLKMTISNLIYQSIFRDTRLILNDKVNLKFETQIYQIAKISC